MKFLVILTFTDESNTWNWFNTEEEAVAWINGYKKDFYGQFEVSEFVEVDVKRKITID
ncbi:MULTISPECIES: hypothetical protein [unclassified Lacrimispora]|uniref:hypothetical protein n=1 Tax=unclassified Lacrimispora TaxID=2719232 RepID=UPI00376FA286